MVKNLWGNEGRRFILIEFLLSVSFTGFTEAEVKVLRLALMKFGIGKWTDIVSSGCVRVLPAIVACAFLKRNLSGPCKHALLVVVNQTRVGLYD